jgi:hypothetical protein
VIYHRPRPHVVEDDEEDHVVDLQSYQPHLSGMVKPAPLRLVRPVAMKVVQPIPSHAVEEFYNEAHRQGIAGSEIHAATAIAQDWHRKWTHQDEQGHTQPEASVDAQFPAHYAYDPMDRLIGAKNPSPQHVDMMDLERKRMRYRNFNSTSSLSGNGDLSEEERAPSPILRPIAKRSANGKYTGTSRPAGGKSNGGAPPQSQGLVLRPVALRVVRPAVLIPPEEFTRTVPHHVIQSLRSSGRQTQLSPLTVPSAMGSKRSTQSQAQASLDCYDQVPTEICHPKAQRSSLQAMPMHVSQARSDLLCALASAGGETGKGMFDPSLEVLSAYFESLEIDTRPACTVRPTEGLWLTLTKPSYFGTLGDNDSGDPMYTLGRMSFDMFSPTNLVCSLQGNFNTVEQVSDQEREALLDSVPKALKEEVKDGSSVLRTYK